MPGQPQQARETLGIRLREIRLNAGLTARALAQLTGWHFTKVSKLEHGTRRPSPDDIRAWCRHCRVEDQVIDLIATARGIDAMYTEWRRQMRAGMRYFQDSVRPLYEQTLQFRVYETTFIPGLLNTAGYAAAIVGFWAGLMRLPADIETAVAARMDWQSVLYAGKRRFVFVIEEQALRTRVGSAEVMAGQLDRLLALMSLPTISLGIIPVRAKGTPWPRAASGYSTRRGSRWKPCRRGSTSPSPPRSASTRRSSACCNARRSTVMARVSSSGAPWATSAASNSANFRQHP
jgi:transcriptional regulator with XRE-family HTH domain